MKQSIKLVWGFILSIIILPIHLTVIFLCYLLSPILPLFAIGKDKLPTYLSWFQTPDAPLDGDSGFVNVVSLRWPKYIRRMLWLIRNPAYGFSWSVLACHIEQGETIVVKGDLDSNDDPYKAGWSFTYIKGTHYYQIRAFIKTLPGKCLKFRLGWKMRYDAKTYGYTKNTPYKYTFTSNPFKKKR